LYKTSQYKLTVIHRQAAVKEPAIAANSVLKHTVLLGLGTVVNKMAVAHIKMGAPKAATMPVIQQAIKVGNMHHKMCVQD